MIHNGLDKLADPEGFAKFVVEPYLHLPMPLMATYAAAAVELVGAGAFAVGAQTRLASLSLLGTMVGALVFHINKTGLEGFPLAVVPAHQYQFETCALYIFIFLLFFVYGGGALSVDGLFKAIKGDK